MLTFDFYLYQSLSQKSNNYRIIYNLYKPQRCKNQYLERRGEGTVKEWRQSPCQGRPHTPLLQQAKGPDGAGDDEPVCLKAVEPLGRRLFRLAVNVQRSGGGSTGRILDQNRKLKEVIGLWDWQSSGGGGGRETSKGCRLGQARPAA